MNPIRGWSRLACHKMHSHRGVKSLVRLIVDQQYEEAVQCCATSRLSSLDLRNVIQEYGRTLVNPPDSAFENLDVIEIVNCESPAWSVRVDLWTKEEGRSDLNLQLTVVQSEDRWLVELDDLLVP